jgi:hypothetical protein
MSEAAPALCKRKKQTTRHPVASDFTFFSIQTLDIRLHSPEHIPQHHAERSTMSGSIDRLKSKLLLRGSSSLPTFCVYNQTSKRSARASSKMGKSNKFDYTHRPNSGAKLGHIIGRDLEKEAGKIQKGAERHHQKARKQSLSGVSDVDASRHVIDLKAPSKELGDEGVCALADGLEVALKSGNAAASLALVDLNVASNGITTASLARLAPIIDHAKCDLATINLSGNNIQVKDDEQAAQWETFLRAFVSCFALRRLDLSGNTELGSRALEIFARVHGSELLISPVAPSGDQSVHSLHSVYEHDDTASKAGDDDVSDSGLYDMSRMTAGQLIKRRCGLRSLPYITLNNVGLDDAGALWLSHILQDHHYPNQLIDGINATNHDSTITTYLQPTFSSGIDWTGNTTLGREGKQLLDRTESIRRQTMLDDQTTMTASIITETEDGDGESHSQTLRRSIDRRSSRAAQGGRRVSIRSIRTDDGGEHEASELESARRRIQRHIISDAGIRSVELWKATLITLSSTRVLLRLVPRTRVYYRVDAADTPSEEGAPHLSLPPFNPIFTAPPELTFNIEHAINRTTTRRPSYASKLAVGSPNGNGSPESAITEVTNTPPTPLKFQKPTTRKDAFSEGADSETVVDKLNLMSVEDDGPGRFKDCQQKRLVDAEMSGRSFRDVSNPTHLPLDVVERIIRMAVGGEVLDVMTADHRRDAIAWALNRETIMEEREWLKKDESAQLWMVLDGMKCLAY